MHPDVQKLLDLQQVDQQIARLSKDLGSLPAEERRRREALEASESTLAARRSELQEAEVSSRNNENAIRHADEELKKLNERLNSVKNNAEYQATLLQIESVKRERNDSEEQGLGLIDRIEGLRAQVVEAQATVTEERRVFDEFLREATALREQRGVQVAEVAAGRDQLVVEIPRDLLDKYQRIFEARGNLAVVAVEGGTCTGCYSSIPPNLLVKVQAGTAVVQCSSCQRILYEAGS